MNTVKMNENNTIEQFRAQVKDNFDISVNADKKDSSVYLNGTNAYISVANNANINFETGTFSIITEQLFESGSTVRFKQRKESSNVGYWVLHNSANKVIATISDGTNTLNITSTNAIADGNYHKIGLICGIDGASSKLIIDGIEDTTATKSGTFPTLTKTNVAALSIGSISGTYYKNEVRNTQLYNYALTVENCRKYMYESLPYSEIGASNTDLTLGNGSFATDTTAWWIKAGGTLTWNSGTADATFVSDGLQGGGSTYFYKAGTFLTVGKRYRVKYKAKSTNHTGIPYAYGGSGSVINTLKAPPLTTTYQDYETEIIATSSVFGLFPFYSFGASLVTAGLDCTIDDLVIIQIGNVLDLNEKTVNTIKWNDSLNRMYGDLINCETTNLPTNHQATLPYNGITGNSTVVIPKGYMIEAIYIKNTTANAITGGIKLGTTSGGTEVISALAISANYNDAIDNSSVILKKFFSDTANTTLYLQAVTAWNSASLNLMIVCRRIL